MISIIRLSLNNGDVAQLVRAPALQAGGRGFESHLLHHFPKKIYHNNKLN